MVSTLTNFGVPLGGGAGRGNILQPKTKHKFRVRVIGFGPINGGLELSQQVMSVGRPSVQFNPETVHSYNSIEYYAGKAEWQTIELTCRDDLTNSVSALVGHQLQKQMNFFQQTTPSSGSNYKFQMYIETLNGGDDAILEQWFLEGCFLTTVGYDQFTYDSSDPLTIALTIRYDNATQQNNLMPINPELGVGNMLG